MDKKLRARRAWKTVVAALGVTLLGITAGCGGSSDAGASPVRMGMVPWIGYGTWYIAQDQKMFAEHGVQVEMTSFGNDDERNAALASGELDVANMATHTALRMAESGVPIKIILLEDFSIEADAIAAGPEISSVADLRGKQVAYEEGSTPHILVSSALQANNMTAADITPVPLPASDAGSALIAGRIPVAATYEPYLSEARAQNPNIHTIYDAGTKPGIISDVLVAREDFIEEHPEQLQSLVNSYGQAMNYYNANVESGRQIISKGVESDPETLKTSFDGVEFFDLQANKTQLNGSFRTETVPVVMEAAKAAGIVEKDVDTSELIMTDFVDGAK